MKRCFVALLAIYWMSASFLAAAAQSHNRASYNHGHPENSFVSGLNAKTGRFLRNHEIGPVADYFQQLKAKAAELAAKL